MSTNNNDSNNGGRALNSRSASDPLIDISHESLIRQWDTLREWVGKEEESRAIYERLARAADLNRHKQEGLYRNPALDMTLVWRDKAKPNEAWARRYHAGYEDAMRYLDKSKRQQRYRIAMYLVLTVLVVVGVPTAYGYRKKAELMNDVLAQKLAADKNYADAQTALQKEKDAEGRASREYQDRLSSEAAAKAKLRQQLAETNQQTQIAKKATATAQKALSDLKVAQERFKKDVNAYVVQNEDYKSKLQTELVNTKNAKEAAEQARLNAEAETKKAKDAQAAAETAQAAAETARAEAVANLKAKEVAEAKAKEEERKRIEYETNERRLAEGQTVTQTHPVVGSISFHRSKTTNLLEFVDDWEARNITDVDIPQLRKIPNNNKPLTGQIRFYRGAAAQLQAAFQEIEAKGLLNRILSWDADYRPLKYSTGPAGHNLGLAFDINKAQNPDGKNPTAVGQKGSVRELAPIFQKYGFEWWGDRPYPVGEHFEVIRVVDPATVKSLPASSRMRQLLSPPVPPDALQCIDTTP